MTLIVDCISGIRTPIDRNPEIEELLKGVPKTYDVTDKKTLLGIEVEVENVPDAGSLLLLSPTSSGKHQWLWKAVEDGSLRNFGREFVSLPISGDNIMKSLQFLKTSFETTKGLENYEFTNRTSVHIHMNVCDMTVEQVATLLLGYALVEPFLYDTFVGGDRRYNIFSVPITDSSLSNQVRRILQGEPKTLFDGILGWQKYTGLNLIPIRSQGTVEFRQMLGTLDLTKLNNWINIILSLKRFALITSLDEAKSLALSINTTSAYSELITRILGEFAEKLSRNYPTNAMFEVTSIFLKNSIYHQHANNVMYSKVKDMFKNPESQTGTLSRLLQTNILQVVDFYKQRKKCQLEINQIKSLIITCKNLKKSAELARYTALLEHQEKVYAGISEDEKKAYEFYKSVDIKIPSSTVDYKVNVDLNRGFRGGVVDELINPWPFVNVPDAEVMRNPITTNQQTFNNNPETDF